MEFNKQIKIIAFQRIMLVSVLHTFLFVAPLLFLTSCNETKPLPSLINNSNNINVESSNDINKPIVFNFYKLEISTNLQNTTTHHASENNNYHVPISAKAELLKWINQNIQINISANKGSKIELIIEEASLSVSNSNELAENLKKDENHDSDVKNKNTFKKIGEDFGGLFKKDEKYIQYDGVLKIRMIMQHNDNSTDSSNVVISVNNSTAMNSNISEYKKKQLLQEQMDDLLKKLRQEMQKYEN